MANTRKRKTQEPANESLPQAKRKAGDDPQSQRLPRTRREDPEEVSEDYEDNARREESEAAIETAQAPKQQTKEGNSLSKLRAEVTQTQASFQSLIEQSQDEITESEAQFQKSFLSCIPANARSSFSRAQSHDRSLAVSDPTSEPLYKTSSALLRQSRALIDIYGQASQMIEQARPAERPDTGWEQDIARVTRLLDSGRRIAQRQIQEVLQTKQDKENEAPESQESAAISAEANAIFGRSPAVQERKKMAGKAGASWAETLVQAEKGVKKMVKALPEDLA